MKLPNGYGSVFKMSGNRRKPYRVRKMTGRTPEGKPIYTNIGYTKTRAEGMLLLASYNIKPWEMESKDLTFKKVYEMTMVADKREYSANTIKARKANMKYLEPLYDAPIKDLKTMHLQEVLDSYDIAPSTKKGVKSMLNMIYTYACKNDILDKNYAEYVKIDFSKAPETNRKALAMEDIISIFKEQSQRHDIVKILLCTGMRISELLDMKNKDVHLEEGYMIGGTKTEAGKNRTIPISRHIKDIIAKYHDDENVYLFSTSRLQGIKYGTFGQWWRRTIEGYVIHDTRHTFITLISNTDADHLSVKKIVGHSSKDITEKVYTHKNIDDLKVAMEHFDKLMDKHLSNL